MMISEYLFRNENAHECIINSDDDIVRFFNKLLMFGAFSKKAGYKIYLGNPLGKGVLNEGDPISALYKLYGIADQSKAGFLLGRKVSESMSYDLDAYSYKQLYVLTRHFAITNDVQSKTSELLTHIQKDRRNQVSGIIIDDAKKIIILTSVTPSMMTDDDLEKL